MVDGAALSLRLAVYFNEMAGFWLMDISSQAGVRILSSVPLLTGAFPAANILAPYGYLKLGSAFVVNASGASDDYPGIAGLGTDFVLLWDDTA